MLTGRVDSGQGAVAIRAVVGGEVATAAQVRSDGSFTIALPAGERYRLEVLTRTGGVKHLVTRTGTQLVGVSFQVCAPVDPFDFGTVGEPSSNGMCDDPADPSCKPQPCDPMTDPGCQPPPPPPPCMDPTDPNCKPPPCDPMTDPNCPPPPPPCDPTTDPNCGCMAGGTCCQPGDPSCPPPPPPCDPTTDPNCKPEPWPCDPADPMCDCMANGTCGPSCTDPTAPGCAPPCSDPTDPEACKDEQCTNDPMSCGCMANEPSCWGSPPGCGTTGCAPGDSMMPEHAPADFGCQGPGTT